MMRDQKSSLSQSQTLMIMLAAFALLAGLYFSLRYAGWWMEVDTTLHSNAAAGMVKSGLINSAGSIQ